jgi:hypothetical protein
MMKQILLLGTMILACRTGWAAPLQPADVAANPAVVAHVDFDAFKATTIGKAVLAQANTEDINKALAAFQAISSFDPRTQWHGLTCYITSEKAQNGVLLLYADFDSNRLVALAQTMPDYHSVTNGSHLIHNWIDEKKKANGGEPNVSAAIAGNRVIFGQNVSAVEGALEVLDGKTPNLTGSLADLHFTAGDFLQGMVDKFDFANKDPNSAILKGCRKLRLEVSETKDHLVAILNLQADDADKATQIGSIGQGLLALGKLQADKTAAMKLANSVAIKQDGDNVSATLSIANADVEELIKAAQEKKAEHKTESTNSVPATKSAE